jgi:hypothetical protein
MVSVARQNKARAGVMGLRSMDRCVVSEIIFFSREPCAALCYRQL